jgi:hypothetical protein
MNATTVRIGREALGLLHQLAREEGLSQQRVLERALEAYRRLRVLEASNDAFARLRGDDAAWKEEQEERRAWDATLGDGGEQA